MACLFCKMVEGEIPYTKVFESPSVLAFLDINPAAKGHTLVIPKKHFTTLPEMPDKELGELVVALREVGKAVANAAKAEGFNLVQSNGKAAGQLVMHVHFHVVPRFSGDGKNIEWGRSRYENPKEQEKWAESIKRNLK